jgi:hypothetical protein
MPKGVGRYSHFFSGFTSTLLLTSIMKAIPFAAATIAVWPLTVPCVLGKRNLRHQAGSNDSPPWPLFDAKALKGADIIPSQSSVSTPSSNDPTPNPTTSRTDRPTTTPTKKLAPAVGSDETRRTLADRLDAFHKSQSTNIRKELRELLKDSVVEATWYLKDLITGSNHTSGIDDISTVEQKSNQTLSDIYADLYESSVLDSSNSSKCTCVDCTEDTVCGELWKGIGRYDKDATELDLHIHIVVSHCKSSLDWLAEFTKGFAIDSIHVITKCGYPVVGAPDSAIILTLPNVGRCDHTYAYYIANLLPQLVPDVKKSNSIVVFLKDDISNKNMHQQGE